MMADYLESRKRSREEDLSCESTPLSKRINNLHINYEDRNEWNDNSSSSSSSTMPTSLINDNNHNHINGNSIQQAVELQNGSNNTEAAASKHHQQQQQQHEDHHRNHQQQQQQQYNPELNKDQNPFYFVTNKMLHDLHMERLKRVVH